MARSKHGYQENNSKKEPSFFKKNQIVVTAIGTVITFIVIICILTGSEAVISSTLFWRATSSNDTGTTTVIPNTAAVLSVVGALYTTTKTMTTSTLSTTTTTTTTYPSQLVVTQGTRAIIYQNLSLPFMLANYTSKFYMTSFASTTFNLPSDLQQVGSTYYVLDWGLSKIILYDLTWVYQSNVNTHYGHSFNFEYANSYWYFTSDPVCIYKTNSNFGYVASYSSVQYCRMLYYDSSSSLLYTVSSSNSYLYVFNANLGIQQTVQLSSYTTSPYGITGYGSVIFIGSAGSSQNILVIENFVITKIFTITGCTSGSIVGITIDNYGSFVAQCGGTKNLQVYDYNGNFLESYATTTGSFIRVDGNGRLIGLAPGVNIFY